jgi:hypothetical protein
MGGDIPLHERWSGARPRPRSGVAMPSPAAGGRALCAACEATCDWRRGSRGPWPFPWRCQRRHERGFRDWPHRPRFSKLSKRAGDLRGGHGGTRTHAVQVKRPDPALALPTEPRGRSSRTTGVRVSAGAATRRRSARSPHLGCVCNYSSIGTELDIWNDIIVLSAFATARRLGRNSTMMSLPPEGQWATTSVHTPKRDSDSRCSWPGR